MPRKPLYIFHFVTLLTAYAVDLRKHSLLLGGLLTYGFALLEQCNVNIVLGHRSRPTYALSHLAPTRHC